MNKSLSMAKGGIITALGVILIYLSSIVPTSKLYLLSIASALIPFSIITLNIKSALLIYAATSILSLLLRGITGTVIIYIVFLGLYGFVKYYVERLRKTFIEIILKLFYFNLSILLIFTIYKFVLFSTPTIKLPLYAVLIIMQLIFIIYDYALTAFIAYINKNFIKKLN